MNRINVSHVVEPNLLQPFTANSLKFLQDSNEDLLRAVMGAFVASKGYTYNLSVPYKVYSLGGSVTNNYIFFNGRLAMIQNPVVGNNIYTETITYPAYDPLLFSDTATSFNVHEIHTFIPSTGVLGTGDFNVSDIVDISSIGNPPWINITIGSNWTIPATFTSFANVFQYKINTNNEVQFRGYAKCVSASSTIFTLPIGVRPLYFKKFIAYNGSTVVTGYIDPTTGDVICDAPVTNGYISIEQFRFSLD